MLKGKRIANFVLLFLLILLNKAPELHGNSGSQQSISHAQFFKSIAHHNTIDQTDDDEHASTHIVSRIKVRYMGGESKYEGSPFFIKAFTNTYNNQTNGINYDSFVSSNHYFSFKLRGPPHSSLV